MDSRASLALTRAAPCFSCDASHREGPGQCARIAGSRSASYDASGWPLGASSCAGLHALSASWLATGLPGQQALVAAKLGQAPCFAHPVAAMRRAQRADARQARQHRPQASAAVWVTARGCPRRRTNGKCQRHAQVLWRCPRRTLRWPCAARSLGEASHG